MTTLECTGCRRRVTDDLAVSSAGSLCLDCGAPLAVVAPTAHRVARPVAAVPATDAPGPRRQPSRPVRPAADVPAGPSVGRVVWAAFCGPFSPALLVAAIAFSVATDIDVIDSPRSVMLRRFAILAAGLAGAVAGGFLGSAVGGTRGAFVGSALGYVLATASVAGLLELVA